MLAYRFGHSFRVSTVWLLHVTCNRTLSKPPSWPALVHQPEYRRHQQHCSGSVHLSCPKRSEGHSEFILQWQSCHKTHILYNSSHVLSSRTTGYKLHFYCYQRNLDSNGEKYPSMSKVLAQCHLKTNESIRTITGECRWFL